MRATSRNAASDAQEFIDSSRVFLKDDFLPKLLQCIQDMSDEDLWWRPNEESNSAGNLILHLCGNLREWILNAIGGGTFPRDRDAEFAARAPVPKAKLLSEIRATVAEVDAVLAALPHDTLLKRCHIQGDTTSRLQAIYHVVEHFSYHLGQILFIYKLRKRSGQI